jgi:hypothetical protein
MREVVARQFQRVLLVLVRHQRQRCIPGEGSGEVHQFAIDARGNRGFRQAGPIAAATSAGVEPGAIAR